MMIFRKNKKAALVLGILMMSTLSVNAQLSSFKFKAGVRKVDSDGVYRIQLSPDFIAKSREDMQDIRLLDNTEKNVAYVLSNKLQLSSPDSYIVFPAVIAGTISDTAVVYIAENKNTLNINRLWLTLKRTEVSRSVNLSGSDDLKSWFAIKEDIPLQQAGTGNRPEYNQSLDFPTSNYRYFKIQVFGKNKTPVKILQAGIYAEVLNNPSYDAIPLIKFTKKDIMGKTSLSVNLPQAYQFNKLHLTADGPKYFSRRIVVSSIDKEGITQVADTLISSAGTGDVLISTKTKKLQIDIYNGDDNPLNIKSVEAYQLKEFAVAYLETGHTYSLFTGNNSAKPVNYDLSFLDNHAYNQLPAISHLKIDVNPAFALHYNLEPTSHTAWLWTTIIIVLFILCFLTFKMVREIK